MGLIVNLEGLDDRLIIHHENSLFRTQDKAKLESGVLSITLGNGDIFQFEPQPSEDTKLGYAGTQHDLACVKTPIGYLFIDAKQGEMYMLKEKLVNLNVGANTFLRDALKIAGNNSYTGNGITIGWDQRYKRVLLSVKNSINEIEQGFTMSYSVLGQGWVFFHDYVPDMYIHTREELFTASHNKIYKHNTGAPGVYYHPTPKPFFIDVVFPAEGDITLETVNWISEYLDDSTDQSFKTLTHVSVWNSHQHSGRVNLRENAPLMEKEIRRTRGEWSFNDFRNILIDKGPKFLLDLFNDFALDPATADSTLPWYYKELLQDQWFCVRFEFDNVSGDTVILHDVSLHATKNVR